MSDNEDLIEIPVSQTVNDTRVLLLKVFQNQLDELLAKRLIPQEEGVPFVDFDMDPPQVITLKKVINCLYHAEEGFKHKEKVDLTSTWNIAKGTPELVRALVQVNKAVGMLDDASPELRAIITNNYNLLAPLFNKTYELIEESGLTSDFVKMDSTDKASKVITQGLELFGPDVEKWNNTNPLISTFTNISKVIETVSNLQQKDMPEKETQEAVELIRSLLDDLNNNAYLGKLTISDFESSKAINDLLGWFKNIQEDGFDFTKKSMQQYISWSNDYLPTLVLLADQLEQQNYLKSGILSNSLCSATDSLGKQINELAADPSLGIKERVITIDSVNRTREQRIETTQVDNVKTIIALENQQIAAAAFYQIMESYRGKPLSEVTEDDRALLRQIYPKIQRALAHANIDVENITTYLLNETGPETPKPQPRTWGQFALDAIGYAATFVVNPGSTRVLETKDAVGSFIANQLASEHFKLTFAEKARTNVGLDSVEVEKTPLKDRVAQRLDTLKNELNKQPTVPEVVPKEFIPVKPIELVNLRGMLTAVQEKKLSETINDTRGSLDILVKRHLPQKYHKHFSTQPYGIEENDPDLVKQIKTIENSLSQLELALQGFEAANLSYGVTLNLHKFIFVSMAAKELKLSILALSPETQKALAPLMQQIMAYSNSLSKTEYNESDLNSLDQLKNAETVIDVKTSVKEEHVTSPKVPEKSPVIEKPVVTEKAVVAKKPELTPNVLEYAEKIANTRSELLKQLTATLADPIASKLVPQKTGVPFINVEKDPPQVAAIKKMINSLYYAEASLKIWSGIDTSTKAGKFAAVHQGVAALSQVYKSFTLFTEATPEVQTLLRENYDLIEPVVQGANDLINQSGWVKQFDEMDVSKTLGSILGQTINLVQPDSHQSTQTASLVKLLSKLPLVMNNIASSLDPDQHASITDLRIRKDKIEAIGAIFELLFEENASLFNAFKGYGAIVGLLELNKKIQKEGMNLQETTLEFYQEWVDEYYPSLMKMLDEVETRYYLKPGVLSGPVSLQIDRVNDKLNAIIEGKPDTKLKQINLSFFMEEERRTQLINKKSEHWFEVFQLIDQQMVANAFFETLGKYQGKSFKDIRPEDRATLRSNFSLIQLAMANINLDQSNELVTILNQLETLPPEKWVTVKVSLDKILELEDLVQNYLSDRQKSCQLKVEVIDKALEHIKAHSFGVYTAQREELTISDLRVDYEAEQHKKPVTGPGELKPIASSSLHNIRGNLAYIQEMEVSSTLALMRNQLNKTIKDNFSSRIQDYLNKPEDQMVHVIKDTDPHKVKQIKALENGVYYLEIAFRNFEKVSKSDSLLSQTKALFEIANNMRQLKGIVENLSPEVKKYVVPSMNKLLSFGNKIRSFDYNQEDMADLNFVIDSIRNELLERNKPRDPKIAKAFFDAGIRPVELNNDPSEAAGKKALKLGVKYMHMASPMLEKARAHLNRRYNTVFGDQDTLTRSLTREQLANEEYMNEQIDRLKSKLDDSYGINVSTVKVILSLVDQIQRAGAQTGELAGMLNTLVTNDFVLMKEKAYEDLLVKLSQEEDNLCLKPGTLVNPAMAAVNQLFLSAALELDMHFIKKLEILKDENFINIIVFQTQKEIDGLLKEQERDPLNSEVAFQINIKKDKLAYLQNQISLLQDKDPEKTVSSLLDIQFEVTLRHHLRNTTIQEPIIAEYEKEVREHYIKNKNKFVAKDDCTKHLNESLKEFEKEKIANYLIVYEAYERLHKFSLRLPEKNKDVKEYIDGINKELTDPQTPIVQRALKVFSLPADKVFIEKLSSADGGTSFLKQFTQFLERIASSIAEAITTGVSVVQIYQKKKMDHLIRNIEKSLYFKDEMHSMKDDDDHSDQQEEVRGNQP